MKLTDLQMFLFFSTGKLICNTYECKVRSNPNDITYCATVSLSNDWKHSYHADGLLQS